jgi:WD40 repeat protein
MDVVRFLWRTCALLVPALFGFALTACAGEGETGQPQRTPPLPGLVPSPFSLPGIGRWQLAHKLPCGRIYSIAWSPDGKKIAYSELSYVRICDATTLETERMLVGHSGRVTSIDWNWATNQIASGSYDGTVRIWSALGVPKDVLQGHTRDVTAVVWTKDGKRLASASRDGTVRIWNSKGALERSLVVSAPVLSIAWSPDGSRLLSGDDRNQIRMWQVDNGSMKAIEGLLGPVTSLAWRPDGKRIASATWGLVEDGKRVVDLRLWNPDGSLADSAVGDQSIYGLQWSPDGRMLAVSYEEAVLQLQGGAAEIKSRMQFEQLDGHTSEAQVVWSPSGKEIALGGTGVITVVNAADLAKSRTYPAVARNKKQFVGIVAMDPSLTRVIAFVGEGGGEPRALLNLATGLVTPVPEEFAQAPLANHSFSPDGRRLVAVVNREQLSIWNPEKGTTDVVVRSEQPISDCAWSPHDDRIAYRDNQGVIRVLKPDGAQVAQFAPRKNAQGGRGMRQFGLEWTRDGKSILARGGTGVDVQRLSGGDPISIEFGMPFNQFWVSPDYERAAASRQISTEGRVLKIWSAGGAAPKDVSLSKDLDALDCSPDVKWSAVGHDSGIWELVHLDDLSVPRQEELASVAGSCMAAIFAPDGRRFATGGWDGLIKIWRIDGTLERTLSGADNYPLYRVWWSADGKHLLSGSREGSLYRWSTEDGRLESFLIRTLSGKLLHISHNGSIAENDRGLAADELNALLEQRDGSMRIVDYPEFLKRTRQAVP